MSPRPFAPLMCVASIASAAASLLACGAAGKSPPTTPPVGLSGAPATGASSAAGARPLSVGHSSATLTAADPLTGDQAHYHTWTIDLDPSRRVRIRMHSGELDPLLEVQGPGEQHLRNDDAFPGVLDAMVDFRPSVPGTYEVRATTYGAGQVGSYTLSVEAREPGGIGRPLTLGAAATATLGADDPAAVADMPGSWFHFEGQPGALVRLRITSAAFDTVATLLGPGGQTWVNDDANELGPDGSERALDSTIVAALPQAGVYQLVVTPYGGAGGGPLTVRSTVRPPVVVGRDGSRPEGLAGPSGGRLLGLYAGITAYPHQGRLYGCADDARLLAQAMREGHLQDESDQLVLPDALATRESFASGLAQLASQARPEDVVLVFFSGHGQQQPDGSDPDELDQLDETIVLYDGSLTDDEVVAALEPIGAGTVILAIDSCHSGGFADDWVRQPGRIGVFSSDEDVLSDTAEPHRAGGYLSWHLRRGVLGEADALPRDGVLQAGELTDYLNAGFVADHRLMNPQGQIDRAQRLVVRRGGISWDDVLWVYPRRPDLSLFELPGSPLTSHPPG